MTDAQEAKEVYDLLNQNYVEDDDNMFRFDYSPAFLEWALTPPGNQKDFVVGIRVTPTAAALAKGKGRGKLVGFITGVPVQMRVYDKIMPMVEINFLCVLKKLRSKRLAPVLIKEITRRVNLTGVSEHLSVSVCAFLGSFIFGEKERLSASILSRTRAAVPFLRVHFFSLRCGKRSTLPACFFPSRWPAAGTTIASSAPRSSWRLASRVWPRA